MMKLILKLEELAMFLGCAAIFYISKVDWWWYLLLLLGPDVSMIGYAWNNKAGAFLYNLFHHKGVAVCFIISGLLIQLTGDAQLKDWLINPGILLIGHSSMDRFFGFGLKYERGFSFTHLGEIGKK